MRQAIIDMVFVGLFAFLFAALSFARKDDRLRCWVAGWLCVMAHFASNLGHPSSEFWQDVLTCISVDTLALAGILFIASTVILGEGRGVALRIGLPLAVSILACLTNGTGD
jgi:hypothetical protein